MFGAFHWWFHNCRVLFLYSLYTMFSASVVIEDAICFIIIQSKRWPLSNQTHFCVVQSNNWCYMQTDHKKGQIRCKTNRALQFNRQSDTLHRYSGSNDYFVASICDVFDYAGIIHVFISKHLIVTNLYILNITTHWVRRNRSEPTSFSMLWPWSSKALEQQLHF